MSNSSILEKYFRNFIQSLHDRITPLNTCAAMEEWSVSWCNVEPWSFYFDAKEKEYREATST